MKFNMKMPFRIFPTIGYRNDQFQIISSADDLVIDLFYQGKVVKSFSCNSNYPVLITSFDSPGIFTAVCKYNNELFQQEIEVKEAYRLGSSEFKRAFLFDDIPFSFLLMKDRMLLYDETRKILLTENNYSPTDIHKINKEQVLFVTRVDSYSSGIINLGVYNLETFSIIGELLNDYSEIIILPSSNKVWLYDIHSDAIRCFEIINDDNECFREIKIIEGFADYLIDECSENIIINFVEKLIIVSLYDPDISCEVMKSHNKAIDKLGNVFTFEENMLIVTNYLTNYSVSVKINFEINLQDEKFIYVGEAFRLYKKDADLSVIVDNIKNDIVSFIPESATYHFHGLSEIDIISEITTTHNVYPTIGGVIIYQKSIQRDFNGITFRRNRGIWTALPSTTEKIESSLFIIKPENTEVLISEAKILNNLSYVYPVLVLNIQDVKCAYLGDSKTFFDKESSFEFYTVDAFKYLVVKLKDRCTLYRINNNIKPILEQIEILNFDLIEKYKVIWYSHQNKLDIGKKYLKAFDLKRCSNINIDERVLRSRITNNLIDFKFIDGYALSSSQIIFDPINFEIRDTVVGNIISYSMKLNKIISNRAGSFYFSKFNKETGRYDLSEVFIRQEKYEEAYLSPDGQFLVLQDESNEYFLVDIVRNETVKYLSGNFLAFRNDGSLIMEQDDRRSVKIFDPKTFQDITPLNYHHYRFISPDGKLYAQVSNEVRFFHRFTDIELRLEEVVKLRKELDDSIFNLQDRAKDIAKIEIDVNRLKLFNTFKDKFIESGISDYTKITSQNIIKVEKYIQIGIANTNVIREIILPQDIQFYNYASFSYDNKYLGLVYRLGTGGGIHFIKLNFLEENQILEINDIYLSRYPRLASWVCGFSKTGFFATYDSNPDTYIINVDDNLFTNKTTEFELRKNIYATKTNIYNTYHGWNEIKGKNFLCFSPTGNYLALSEQGYEPLTLGGYGHQESSVVHIAKTQNGKILDSFMGHGDKIKEDKNKKVTFVAFSEDEKRIMSLSIDGVVIIRDLKISDN